MVDDSGRLQQLQESVDLLTRHLAPLAPLPDQMSEVRAQLTVLDGKFDGLEGKFDVLDGKVDVLDGKVDNLAADFGDMKQDVNVIKEIVRDHSRRLTGLEDRVGR